MIDTQWSGWASQAPEWLPPPGPVVIVGPHPDDETLGAGGLIFTCSHLDIKVTVVSITDGEAACPEVPMLEAVRRRELVGAMRRLGLAQTDIFRLGMPDGALASREVELAQALAKCMPDGAIMFAPFEYDGHPDHEAAGRACRTAARMRGLRIVRYPIWAWERSASQLLMERAPVRFVLGSRAQQAKLNAISQFRSQIEPRPGGAIVPTHMLEYFSRPYEVFLL
jgi:LmbE family N-acetylglucosaminyl deacetylase